MDTDQDMFAKLAEATATANVALERVIVVFDFDLTLSETHTGGHGLRVLARESNVVIPTRSYTANNIIMQFTQAPLKLEQGHYF